MKRLVVFLSLLWLLPVGLCSAAYDPMNTTQVAALKAELVNDPSSLGYAASFTAGDHGTPTNLINQVRAGAPYQVDRENVATYVLFASVDATEFAALTALQLSQLTAILSAGQVDLSKANIRTMLGAIFPSAGPTRAAFVGLAKRQGSRAEVLFGMGTSLTSEQISKAWRS